MLWSLAGLVPVGTPFRTALFLPGTFAPAIVALWIGGRSLIDRIFIWQVQTRWYLFAILYLAVIKLAAAIVYRLTSGAWPAIAEDIAWPLFLLGALVSWPVQAGEEIGWRGYALPRLTQLAGGLAPAAIVLGLIWAAWHLPLFFIPGTDTTGQSFPLYAITVTAISIAIAWLYERTGGSLLLVMLLHAAANNTPHFTPDSETGNVWALHATRVQWLTALFLWIAAAFMLVRMRQVKRLDESVATGVS